MSTFAAPDQTQLSYRTEGSGEPLVCIPGGPMQDSVYLGELGGLSAHRELVFLDLRGTGQSDIPSDISSYRCDRQVADVEALRMQLGLDQLDLLGHSASTNLVLLYAASHPERVRSLTLVTPSPFAVGLAVTGEQRHDAAQLRKDEPWFDEANSALEAIMSGEGSDWAALAPFSYGRWDEAAQQHQAAEDEQRNDEAAGIYGSEGAFDPDATREALAALTAPVLVLSGEVDLGSPAALAPEFAGLFADAEVVVQPGAGHFPWLDDPAAFVKVVEAFLAN